MNDNCPCWLDACKLVRSEWRMHGMCVYMYVGFVKDLNKQLKNQANEKKREWGSTTKKRSVWTIDI